MLAQEFDGAQKQVVEIESRGLAQDRIVGGVDFGGLLALFVARLIRRRRAFLPE